MISTKETLNRERFPMVHGRFQLLNSPGTQRLVAEQRRQSRIVERPDHARLSPGECPAFAA